MILTFLPFIGMWILIGLTFFWIDTRVDLGRPPRWQWIVDSILIGVWISVFTIAIIHLSGGSK